MAVNRKTAFACAIGMLALLAGSAVVAWQVPLPEKLPIVAWNSSWVFRAEVFVGFFVGAYVLLVIAITTVASGQPPKKLSFGLLAFEQPEFKKTVEALAEGGTALQAVENETRELEERLDRVLEAVRSAHQALVDVAAALPEGTGEDIARRARAQVESLSDKPGEPQEPRREFIQAMTRFDHLLRELDQLRTKKDG
jgi:hypothetical protein